MTCPGPAQWKCWPDQLHGIWGGLTERERRALRSGWVRASRRERDRAILAAEAAGYTAAAIGRSFGLSRTSVTRIVRTRNEGARPEPDGFAPQTLPTDEGETECTR